MLKKVNEFWVSRNAFAKASASEQRRKGAEAQSLFQPERLNMIGITEVIGLYRTAVHFLKPLEMHAAFFDDFEGSGVLYMCHGGNEGNS